MGGDEFWLKKKKTTQMRDESLARVRKFPRPSWVDPGGGPEGDPRGIGGESGGYSAAPEVLSHPALWLMRRPFKGPPQWEEAHSPAWLLRVLMFAVGLQRGVDLFPQRLDLSGVGEAL